jgi:5-methylcytosine-specific restriction enzyme A
MTTETYREKTKKWYDKRRWKHRSADQLHRHPLCEECKKSNIVTIARVADHITPHKGDPISFWLGELQSLCLECHNKTKKLRENRGYVLDIGDDGFPLDPSHPFNKKRG